MTYRPELHVALESGVLEAPAGALVDGTTWHLFYQYRPRPGEPSRWGHVFAEEAPFEWLECDDALAPVGGEFGLRAGSVAAVGPDINLYFTSLTAGASTIRLAKYTSFDETCEVSNDPQALDPNVARHGEVISNADGFARFRSPCVVPDWATSTQRDDGHEGWLMVALSGSTENPTPVILRSADGNSWNFEGPLTFKGDTSFPGTTEDLPAAVVSPRIMRLRDEIDGEIYDIMFFTVEAVGEEHGEVAGYLVGCLHGTEFEVRSGFQRLDYGHDFTRPRNTSFTPGTRSDDAAYEEACLFGLLNGRGRGDNPAVHHSWTEEGWANALTLPRLVTLQGGVLYQTPPRGLPDAVSDSKRARMWTGLLEVPAKSSVTVTLLDGNGKPATTVTHAGTELRVDRSMSAAFDDTYKTDIPAVAPLTQDPDNIDDSLTIVVDGTTVEIFADSGLVAMASRMYFDGGCSGFHVESTGKARVVRHFERAGS